MSKFDRLCELREQIINDFGSNEYNVGILINTEDNHLSAIYKGHRVCKIRTDGNGYKVTFTSEFGVNGHETTQWFPGYRSISSSIRNAIWKYKERQEVKNMANRRFIVEKMEVEQRCCGPDVINMTIRKEPDGLIPETGKELKALIESLDPDKLSSDNRINVNVDNNTVQKAIYMMARGKGKTRYVSELLKNKTVVYNGNIHTNIENVIFNNPATIVFWTDGSKTVVKCQKGETFDPEKGLAMAISKKVLGNDYGYYETFAKHVGRYNKKHKEK